MRFSITAPVLAMLVSMAGSAFAGLGGAPIAHANNDTHGARLLTATSVHDGYRTEQQVLDSGTTVTEYVGTDNLVFAVSWSGPTLPDFEQLLGKHVEAMKQQARSAPHAGHSQLALNRPDLVVVSSGHMRAFNGRAWLPASLPARFAPSDIR
ncbi:MAG: DUF2844 domain-containing protein [Pseudomonadota bacterium]|nr:DUF2844 domain-containing protein [Pseudomonadota bacterium]